MRFTGKSMDVSTIKKTKKWHYLTWKGQHESMNVTNIFQVTFHKGYVMQDGCSSYENSKKVCRHSCVEKMIMLLALLLGLQNMKTDSLQENISWYAKLF
jgi:hypothetical protein